jgi:hypothetical protein
MNKILIINYNIFFDKQIDYELLIKKIEKLRSIYRIGIISNDITDYFGINDLNLNKYIEYAKCANLNKEELIDNVIGYLKINDKYEDTTNYNITYLDNDNKIFKKLEKKNISSILIKNIDNL